MILSRSDVESGFWRYRPDDGFPPGPIRYVQSYDGSTRLNVSCTQTELSFYEQNKLVGEWCQFLPTLTEVRFLWFSSRVSQPLFDAACSIPNLTGLYVKWSGIKSLEALQQLSGLRYLHLGSSSQVESIERLSSLGTLKVLELENLKRIQQLDPLAGLSGLEGLALWGADKPWKVDTLTPLGSLNGLRYLFLNGLRPADTSLEPLRQLKNLENLKLGRWWPEEEVIELQTTNLGLRIS